MVERIRKLCQEHGTTVKALERELGLGNGTVSRWGTSSPSVRTVEKVAAYFGVSIDWLVKG